MSEKNQKIEEEKITGKDVSVELLKLLFPFLILALLYIASLVLG